VSIEAKPRQNLDAVIAGGGIAGLWTLNQLLSAGYNAILVEARELGCEQTLASQGMIHGGLKYALAGTLTGASEAIADMPDRWRRAMAGEGPVNLSGLQAASECYYMYAGATTLGRLTGFFASRALRGRIDRIKPDAYPPILKHPGFSGVVYQLNDFVLDMPSLLRRLSEPVLDRIHRLQLSASNTALAGDRVVIDLGECEVSARHLIACAGAGNEDLIDILNLEVATQRRPLHQVVVRHPDLKPFYAHCISGSRQAEPRITFTSVDTPQGCVWYLGGQLATSGVDRSEAEQINHARAELDLCVPWIDWQEAELTTFRVDRAEPLQQGMLKPDAAVVSRTGPVIVAWPTKLSLAPDLGAQVAALMDPPQPGRDPVPQVCAPPIGSYPWLT
jgi:hypothetical protein